MKANKQNNLKKKVKRKIIIYSLIVVGPIVLMLLGLIFLIMIVAGPERLLPDLDQEELNEFKQVATYCNISWEEMLAYITVVKERDFTNLEAEDLALDFMVITYKKYTAEKVGSSTEILPEQNIMSETTSLNNTIWMLDYEKTLEKKEDIISFSKSTNGPSDNATSIVDHLRKLDQTNEYDVTFYSKEMEDFYENLNDNQKEWYNALISENLIQKLLGEDIELPDTILVDSKGFLAWPVPGITGITSPFGNRNNPTQKGSSEFHTGIDIAQYGCNQKPVIASADGIIASVQYKSTGYGNNILIKHTDDKGIIWTTRYCHLSAIEVSNNQEVKRGDVIGAVGSTGRSTGPHLHFEVKCVGQLVNPVTIIGK